MDDLTGIVFSRLSSLVIGGVTEQDGLIVRRAHDRAAWVVSAYGLLPHSDNTGGCSSHWPRGRTVYLRFCSRGGRI
jgi:hypothetical protein